MKIFNKKKSKGYIDLSSHLEKQENKKKTFIPQKTNSEGLVDLTGQLPKEENTSTETKPSESNSNNGFFGFFSQQKPKEEAVYNSDPQEEKKKRLIKRIMNLTNRLEDQEKEIHSLKQRIEVLERKQKLGY